jgi:hypothetical protein
MASITIRAAVGLRMHGVAATPGAIRPAPAAGAIAAVRRDLNAQFLLYGTPFLQYERCAEIGLIPGGLGVDADYLQPLEHDLLQPFKVTTGSGRDGEQRPVVLILILNLNLKQFAKDLKILVCTLVIVLVGQHQ